MGSREQATLLRQEVQKAVDRVLAGKKTLSVLEAGCGSMVHLRFPESSRVTGIDMSQFQLDRNQRLHDRIVGDLQSYQLPVGAYDAVVCWNVLEHLRRPEEAVKNLAGAVRPGGVLVLACPNPRALRSLAARMTPLWFHVWFYKNVLGLEKAGEDDVGPFPTIMSPRIAPDALCELARSCGLEVELKLVAKGNWWWGKRSVVRHSIEWTVDALGWALRKLTWGRCDGELAQTRLVLRKVATP